ncbi:MAG: hypothetical protein E7544_09305 [Ruminococcaceae bacterium]|nr:hypothetical protein [Oscillospiraceae bacterium]
MKTKPRVSRPVKTSLQSSVIIYTVFLMFGLPLIVTDKYFNITETKSVYFYILSIALVVAAGFFASNNKNSGQPTGGSLLKKAELSHMDKAMIVFCLFVFLSAVFSSHSDVWVGVSSRYQGFITILLYVAVYFIVSRNFTAAQSFLLFSVLAFSIVCILGVLNCFDIDIFGFYDGINSNYKTMFLSTVGNINFYSSYICLLMPLVVSGFCLSEGKISRGVYTSALVIGSMGMMVTSSESFVVGFASSIMIMPLFFYGRLHRFKRYLISLIIIVLSSQLYMIIYRVYGEANIAVSKLLSVFVNPYVAAAIILLCLGAYLIACKAPKGIGIMKKVYPVLLVAFVIGIIVCFILANTVGLERFNGLFKITSEWGTYRGKIWRFCAKSYLGFEIKDKLFGVGPESLTAVTAGAKLFERKSLDQAHNEYLQYLMTTGVFGLGAYLGVIGATIYTVIKKLRNSTLAVALLAGLVSYWMQATVNIAQPFTTPIMYIYIAYIAGMARNAQRNS